MSPADEAAGAAPERRGMSAWSPYAVFLVALMAAGSAFMWVGLPLLLVYVASQVADSSQPSMGVYMIVIVGLPAGMFAVGKALGTLDRHYGQLRGTAVQTHRRASWLRSMRAERRPTSQATVLDVVMVVSVGVCLVVMAIWFFFLAGDPTPGG